MIMLPRLLSLLSSGLLLTAVGTRSQTLLAQPDPPAAVVHPARTSEQLERLVAPIALYPDGLVAQVLAASTFPEQVVEADRWLRAHSGLSAQELGAAVDKQPWDPSVKALTGFPAVLGNMDTNLSWTSALGDAYYNQQADVMDSVQTMRRRAQDAGKLGSTPQQTVAASGPTITIVPADPQVIYVPAYDPWTIYGGPVVAWPGWYGYPGIWFGGPALSFGMGFGMGFYGGYGWGWSHWGFDWHNRYATFNHGRYFGGNPGYRSGAFRGGRGPGGMRGGGAGRAGRGMGGAGQRGQAGLGRSAPGGRGGGAWQGAKAAAPGGRGGGHPGGSAPRGGSSHHR